jgi:integrase
MRPAVRPRANEGAAAAPFATSKGGGPSKDSLRGRVIGAAIRRAHELLEDAGEAPLPHGLTPHGLRHTYASLLVALGEEPRYETAQIGHTDPAFMLRLYTHQMRRDGDERDALQALVRRPNGYPTGTSGVPDASPVDVAPIPDTTKAPG